MSPKSILQLPLIQPFASAVVHPRDIQAGPENIDISASCNVSSRYKEYEKPINFR